MRAPGIELATAQYGERILDPYTQMRYQRPVTVVVGSQRGDEGKGRAIDMLAPEFDFVARFNGGQNAGHTVVAEDGTVLKLHIIPSGIAHQRPVNIIGNGTLIDPVKFISERDGIVDQGFNVDPGKLLISSAAHLLLPCHVSEDEIREQGKGAQGSTKSGIAQVAASKSLRENLRMEVINNDIDALARLVREGLIEQRELRRELKLKRINIKNKTEEYVESARLMGEYITDTVLFLNSELKKPEPPRVLAEGAQAFLLDIDHGMYPMTTSTNTTSGAVATGLGIPPKYIGKVYGVAKVTQSHVGGGPFVTEIKDERTLKKIHGDKTTVDAERGTTTGRERRMGHLDLPALRRAQMVNGDDELVLTKLDWLNRYDGEIPVCVAYERKGKQLNISPDAAYKLEQSKPIYEMLEGWSEDIQNVRYFEELPKAAREYVEFVEEKTEVPVSIIGVGPGRDQVIIRSEKKPTPAPKRAAPREKSKLHHLRLQDQRCVRLKKPRPEYILDDPLEFSLTNINMGLGFFYTGISYANKSGFSLMVLDIWRTNI